MSNELHDPSEAVYGQRDLPAWSVEVNGRIVLYEEIGEKIAEEDEHGAQRPGEMVQLDIPEHVDPRQYAGRVEQHVLAVGQPGSEARWLGEGLERREHAERRDENLPDTGEVDDLVDLVVVVG
ncbi:unnamed protein product [Phytophthora fragariaefolia]|uniref:Unnamed protein product n=1 Tax=Phytophthora fragariaefolia TaxID=1490495 RepID=A0A9W6X615_9STRA|nr:unnamed protein product [Phytophthora fragariaefolia]